MKYFFREFIRHCELWQQAKSLTKVFPYPDHPHEAVQIAGKPEVAAAKLRVQHMMRAIGYGHKELKAFVGPFIVMMSFIDDREDSLVEAGLIGLTEHSKIPSMKLLRAVHQTFRDAPSLAPNDVPTQQVIDLANSYPAEWMPSEYP